MAPPFTRAVLEASNSEGVKKLDAVGAGDLSKEPIGGAAREWAAFDAQRASEPYLVRRVRQVGFSGLTAEERALVRSTAPAAMREAQGLPPLTLPPVSPWVESMEDYDEEPEAEAPGAKRTPSRIPMWTQNDGEDQSSCIRWACRLFTIAREEFGEAVDSGALIGWLCRFPFEVSARAVKSIALLRSTGTVFTSGPVSLLTVAVTDPAFGHAEFSVRNFGEVERIISERGSPRRRVVPLNEDDPSCEERRSRLASRDSSVGAIVLELRAGA